MKKCVVVGTGQRGVNCYIKPIAAGHLSDVVKIVGVCDSIKDRAELCSAEYGNFPVFSDFDEMLDATKPDFVIVTTLDADHHEYIIKALKRGYDVVSEKPMTTSRKNALAIMAAEKESGKKVRVTFNMRYMKPLEDFKRVIASGVIGEVKHADFTWLLDRSHGADYFRRWHRYLRNTNSLLIHKSTHHFDVINWIMGNKVPKSVFARTFLDFYGKNGEYRAECCHKCPHTEKCPYYFDVTAHEFNKKYYYDIEAASGYYRDGCIFAEDIDIFDRMALSVYYEDGATMNYSLVAYSPEEGYKINLMGTKGRAEMIHYSSGPSKSDDIKIRIVDLEGKETVIDTAMKRGDHGGADITMRDDIFRDEKRDDPLGQVADSYAGYLSLAIGDMAVKSGKEKREIFIDEL